MNGTDAVQRKVAGDLAVAVQLASGTGTGDAAASSAPGNAGQEVAVIAYTERKLSDDRLKELRASGISIEQESWIQDVSDTSGSYYARAPAAELSTLAAVPAVERIDRATAELATDDSVPMTNATGVHDTTVTGPNGNTNQSLTGESVRVAVIDTGIDDDHPSIQGKVVAEQDYVGDGNTFDENGHGTHVATTIASGNETYTGMAPGVELVDLDVGDSPSGALTGNTGQAVRDAATRYDADVISMSLGRRGGIASHRTGTSRLAAAVREARENGALVVVSAMNSGDAEKHVRGTVAGGGATWADVQAYDSPGTGPAVGSFYLIHPSSSNLTVELYNTASGTELDGATGVYEYDNNQSEDDKGFKHDTLAYAGLENTSAAGTEYAVRVVNDGSQPVTFDLYQEAGQGGVVKFGNKTSPKRTLQTPADSEGAIAVGSVVANDSWTDSRGNTQVYGRNDDPGNLSTFSSRGPTVDGRTKPEVVAPGEAIVAAASGRGLYAPSSVVDNGTGGATVLQSGAFTDLDGGWVSKSGTSMAAPHVSGLAALLIQKSRAVDGQDPAPRTVKAALMGSTTRPDRPTQLQTSFDNRTGTGLINAQYGLATVSVTGATGGETDRVWLRYPENADQTRLGATAAVQLNASGLPWEETPQGVTVALGQGDSPFRYSRKAIVTEEGIQPGRTNALSIDGGTSRVNWSAATLLLPAKSPLTSSGSSGSDSVDSYDRVPDAELDPDATAAFAVPVDRAVPGGDFEPRHGSVRATAHWAQSSSDVDIRVDGPDGTTTSQSATDGAVPVASAIGSSATGGHKVVFTRDGGDRSVNTTLASNYPLVALPSAATVTDGDTTAGNASNPDPIEFDVTVETANRPYSPKPYGQVDSSHFTVTVGGKAVSSDALTVTSPTPRPGEYHLKFTPPKQPTAGQYNLTVAFNDTKLDVSHTTSTKSVDAVDYVGTDTGAGSSATVLIVDDSESMSGSKITDARQAAKEYVTLLSDSDKVAVSRYDSGASTVSPLTLVSGNRSAIRADIDEFDAGGGTDIGEGLNVGYTEVTKASTSTPKAAILLTDGQHNGEVEPRTADDKYANADIPVYTIALGDDADETLLKDISNATGGEFKSTPTSSNLSDIYADLGRTVTDSSTIAATSGSVTSGKTTSETFSIDDSTSTAKVRTQLDGSDSASSAAARAAGSAPPVRLSFPNGTAVPMSDTGSGYEAVPSNVEYTKIGSTHIYRVDDPDPGAWSTTVRNTQSEQLDYATRVTGAVSATLSLSSGSQTYVNESQTTLTAQFVDESGGLSGGSVEAAVTLPDGDTKQVALSETSAGVYEGTVSNSATGTVSVTVEAETGNVSRQKSLSWSVVNSDSVLRTDAANETTPSTRQGGAAVVGVNLTLPESASTATTDTTAGAPADGDANVQSAISEVAGSEPGTYNESEVDPAVRQAAGVLRNQSDDTTTTAASQVAAPDAGTTKAYLRMGTLTGPDGTTIAASDAQVTTSVVPLDSGQTETVGVRVDTADGVPTGTYTGTLDVSVSGTVVTYDVTVVVTEATATTYRTRISEFADQWRDAGPSGKAYYEAEIADDLTRVYFDDDGTATQTAGLNTTRADRGQQALGASHSATASTVGVVG